LQGHDLPTKSLRPLTNEVENYWSILVTLIALVLYISTPKLFIHIETHDKIKTTASEFLLSQSTRSHAEGTKR